MATCSNFQRNDLKTLIHILLSGNLIRRKSSSSKKFELDEEGLIIFKRKLNVIETNEISFADYESDIELFNVLKEIRTRASKKFMQTGYLICPDDCLGKS